MRENKLNQNAIISTTRRKKRKPEEKKSNHIVADDDDAPFDNIDEISWATSVRPDSCDDEDGK